MTKEQLKRLDKDSDTFAESKEKLNKQLTDTESKIAVMPLKTWLVKPSDWDKRSARRFRSQEQVEGRDCSEEYWQSLAR
jgi:hypothetical protein